MKRQKLNLDHLQGLQRKSPCCIADVYHPWTMNHAYPECITLWCMACHKVVKEHWLFNDRGELVWPPPQEWIDRQPPAKKRKRCRRKVPLEQEPEGYKVIY